MQIVLNKSEKQNLDLLKELGRDFIKSTLYVFGALIVIGLGYEIGVAIGNGLHHLILNTVCH